MKKVSPSRNSLSQETRIKCADLLNQILADLTDLHSQTKHAHWNVRGPLFYSLHKLFDDLAAAVEAHIDPVAERITALGGVAQGTIRQAAAHSRLPEFPENPADDLSFVTVLIERFGRAANDTRKGVDESAAAGDAATADLLTGVSRDLDQGLWMLEAHLRT